MEPSDIKSMDFDELRAELAALGEKEFRAAQIYEWLHKKLCGSFFITSKSYPAKSCISSIKM